MKNDKKTKKQEQKVKDVMEKKKNQNLRDDIENHHMVGNFDISSLTQREEMYFRVMFDVDGGVLYVKGEPGMGKSAMIRGICEKLNLLHIDLRLSQLDETDVGLYPDKIKYNVKHKNSKGEVADYTETFLTHIIPEWAYIANNPKIIDEKYEGTIINFEELNRAPLAVRNAALQILLEREIGFKGFKFNDNVFMAATGNLGDEDDTDVEEFDFALEDRLVPFRHDVSYYEWRDNWAQGKVHSSIISFLNINTEYFYNKKGDDEKKDKFPTPRAWTFLSNMLNKNFGKIDPDTREVVEEAKITPYLINFISKVGPSYIGSVNTMYIQHLEDIKKFSIWDILGYSEETKPGYEKGFSSFSRKDVDEIGRSKRSELLEKIKNLDYKKLSEEQIENLKQFVLNLRKEERSSFFIKAMDDFSLDYDSSSNHENILSIMNDSRFQDIVDEMEDSLQSN